MNSFGHLTTFKQTDRQLDQQIFFILVSCKYSFAIASENFKQLDWQPDR